MVLVTVKVKVTVTVMEMGNEVEQKDAKLWVEERGSLDRIKGLPYRHFQVVVHLGRCQETEGRMQSAYL